MNFDSSISARGSQQKLLLAASYMYVATSSSLLVLHKDFIMAEFKFMQVKTTFDDKLNYLELINAALEQWPLLNCSLLFQQNETFSSRGS